MLIRRLLRRIDNYAARGMRSLMPAGELTRLANSYGSDKGTKNARRHHYTRVYEKIFRPLRNEPINILEIGLQFDPQKNDCPSLAMWAEYFPKAGIYGFDIKDFSGVDLPRTRIFRGDQGKKEDLMKMVAEAGVDFDVIIDDGSHAPHHQQITLARLFPSLKSGGLYVIEDLHWIVEDIESEPGYSPDKYTLTKELFKTFIRTGTIRSSLMSPEESKYLEENIKGCTFYSSLSPWRLDLDHRHAMLVIVK